MTSEQKENSSILSVRYTAADKGSTMANSGFEKRVYMISEASVWKSQWSTWDVWKAKKDISLR